MEPIIISPSLFYGLVIMAIGIGGALFFMYYMRTQQSIPLDPIKIKYAISYLETYSMIKGERFLFYHLRDRYNITKEEAYAYILEAYKVVYPDYKVSPFQDIIS